MDMAFMILDSGPDPRSLLSLIRSRQSTRESILVSSESSDPHVDEDEGEGSGTVLEVEEVAVAVLGRRTG